MNSDGTYNKVERELKEKVVNGEDVAGDCLRRIKEDFKTLGNLKVINSNMLSDADKRCQAIMHVMEFNNFDGPTNAVLSKLLRNELRKKRYIKRSIEISDRVFGNFGLNILNRISLLSPEYACGDGKGRLIVVNNILEECGYDFKLEDE